LLHALITGAAGFVGSHASTHLIEEGCDARRVGSFTTHYAGFPKELNIAAPMSERHLHPSARERQRDAIAPRDRLERRLAETGVRPTEAAVR